MTEIEYKLVYDADDPVLDDVKKLFAELYDHLKDKGQQNPLVPDGDKKWIDSARKSLNRMGMIVVAIKGKKTIGFAHGTIRFLPDFLGGEKTAFIAHQYILPEFRGGGKGRKLYKLLEKWFISKGIKQIELYVNYHNEEGLRFYEANGYRKEVIQLRKFID